jgi:hypothetical protein
MRAVSASLPVRTLARPTRIAGRVERDALHLTSALLAAMLLLQRFGIPFGAKPISVVGPIGFLIAAVGLARGTLAFDRRRTMAFLAFIACVTAGMVWQQLGPSPFGTPINNKSMAQFVVLSGFAVLCFAEPVDEARFFRLVANWFAAIAVAGALQFAAQFAGLRLFQFTGLLPASILYEANYNQVIPIGIGSLLKSNGFFLVEPSVFSQILALGIIMEVLSGRRPWVLALFAGSLLISFSGTGWIVLASFFATAAVGMGARGLALAAGMALALALAAGAALLAAPEIITVFNDRASEFAMMGTSAHLRFITPFWLTEEVLARDPQAALLGIGSGASESMQLPWLFNVNTPIKVFLEYGLPALVAYLSLFLLNRRTPVQRALVVPAMVMFLVAGAYQQFPPMLFLTLLLLCTARLRAAPA